MKRAIIFIMVKQKSKRWGLLASVIVVSLLTLAVGVIAVLAFTPKAVDKREEIAQTKVADIVSKVAPGEDSKVAQKKLEELAAVETDKKAKAIYLSGLSDLYQDSGEYKKAVETGMAIEDIEQTAITAAQIASAYMELGDYPNAAKYFGIAASRSDKPSRSTERTPYNDYMIAKAEAEALIK